MLVLLGGNGFVGRHATIRAYQRGIPVAVVAPAPDPDFLKRHAPSARSITLDEFEGPSGDAVLREATALVHLAARSVPISHIDTPARELTENVQPAFQVFLRVARLRPELPILFLSSGGAVYGNTSWERIPETEPLRPISPYALGKVLTEQCLAYCGDTMRQNYAILRVSNPVGRWHRDRRQGLVTAILRAIRTDTPLEVYGDGSAVRDFFDADDLADAILSVAAVNRPLQGVWNVGSGVGRSVLEMVSIVAEIVGRAPRTAFKPSRPIDVPRAVLDTTRLHTDFGWQALTPLQESIRKLISSDISGSS